MMSRNLRHLRILLAIDETKSVSRAGDLCGVSQPAVTQALAKMEREASTEFFRRTPNGLFATEAGKVVLFRVKRAIARLDDALDTLGPRLKLTATFTQLRALIAVADAASYSLAAQRSGVSQPTLHRAVAQISKEAERPLFERTSLGLAPTRRCRDLVMAVRLADAELEQVVSDLAVSEELDPGRVVVGALPLSRSGLLPKALARFRKARPRARVTVVDGLYEDLLRGLRHGEIDILIGALRDPPPSVDVQQQLLFDDSLIVLARPGHDLGSAQRLGRAELAAFDWVVPRQGTPTRRQFDEAIGVGQEGPRSIIETGSILLMRELLCDSDMLGCISRQQALAEVSKGLLSEVAVDLSWKGRPIGLTTRADFAPTKSQALLLDLLRASVAP